MVCKGVCVTDFNVEPNSDQDASTTFTKAAAALRGCEYGTIYVPDGVFTVNQPVELDHNISLHMAPSAKIIAGSDFEGEAVVVKGGSGKPEKLTRQHHGYGGQICGGIIDGGGLAVKGIKVPWGRRYSLRDLEVHNARGGGIHLGPDGWYEATLHNVRIALDFDVPHIAGVTGLVVDGISDNHISQVLVIGYETGVYATGSSTAFHQVHVWNGPNRPLTCAFHAAGWNDMYAQCQADAYDDTAFYVNAPFQRFIGNFMQTHHNFSQPTGLKGFSIGPMGTHGTYVGNFHNARQQTPIEEAFSGSMEGATVLGNLYTQHVKQNLQNRIPSASGGTSWIPPFEFDGSQVKIGDASEEPPSDTEGTPGELRWCENNGECALYLRTATGWKKARFE